jgi:hypothetical protein
MFLELKREKGRHRPGQLEWIGALARIDTDVLAAYVVRPRHLDQVLEMLR